MFSRSLVRCSEGEGATREEEESRKRGEREEEEEEQMMLQDSLPANHANQQLCLC